MVTKGVGVVVRVQGATDWSALGKRVVDHLVLLSAVAPLRLVALLFWAWR